MLLFLLPIAIAGKSMAPWVPTRSKDIQRLIDILDLKPGQKFFEIGCGDGRVSRAVAAAFPESHITGLELAYPVWMIAKIKWYFSNTPNCKIQLWNAFKQDFSHFDILYVYGMPDKMWAKIVPKFLSEAQAGAKLYSYVFSIPQELSKDVVSHWNTDEAKIHVLVKK